MEKMMYLAAQYLAAAGISFLDKKEDDSHTNLQFISENASLNSRPLNEQDNVLSLNYERFTLEWKNPVATSSLRLDGSTHRHIVDWIDVKASDASIAVPYKYNFHYDLPYNIKDNFTFKLLDSNRLSELTHLRILAQLVLEKFLNNQGLISEIRVWPHHFDTGAYATTDKKLIDAVGLGLAIPDAIVGEHYFYISGYKNNKAIDPGGMAPLVHGHWHNKGFVGAVLPAMGATVQEALAFFEDAFRSLSGK